MRYCHQCGWEWPREEAPGFRDVCPRCQAFLHCCLNCALWNADRDACTSRTTEPPANGASHNFCEEFRFAFRVRRGQPTDALSRAADARRRWEGLFKK
jgi:hypothetical protein